MICAESEEEVSPNTISKYVGKTRYRRSKKVVTNLPKNKWKPNRWGELAPIFFYHLIDGFRQSKDNTALWSRENGEMLLSQLLITLSAIIENIIFYPIVNILARDLFELSWPLFEAENSDIRIVSLISCSICLPFLYLDVTGRNSTFQIRELIRTLEYAAMNDPHPNVRALALDFLNRIKYEEKNHIWGNLLEASAS